MKFYEKLKNLTPHEVGRIVEEIISRCPSAFNEIDEENAQVILDNLNVSSFNEVNNLLNEIFEESVDKVSNKQKVQWWDVNLYQIK